MQSIRKLQLTAAGVAANSLVALTLLAPNHALAATCNPTEFCVPTPICENQGSAGAYCETQLPPGCTFNGSVCLGESCGTGALKLVCEYE